MKFYVGDTIHDVTAHALAGAGLLVEVEKRVTTLPEPVGGRLDIIYFDPTTELLVLWDGKSVRSDQLTEYAWQLPKPKDIKQIRGYEGYLPPQDFDVLCLEYIDQAGSNPPCVCWLQKGDCTAAREEVALYIAEFKKLPELPDEIGPELKQHWPRPRKRKTETDEEFEVRKNLPENRHIMSVGMARSWECGWCDFFSASCHPTTPDEEKKLAEWDSKKKMWEYTPEGKKRIAWIVEQLGGRM